MEERTGEKNMSIRAENPKLISMREVAFRKEEEHVALELQYWIRGVSIERSIKTHIETGEDVIVRSVVPRTISKHILEVLLKDTDEGEEIYKHYLEIIKLSEKMIRDYTGIEDDKENYKKAIQARIKEDKEEELNENIGTSQASIH